MANWDTRLLNEYSKYLAFISQSDLVYFKNWVNELVFTQTPCLRKRFVQVALGVFAQRGKNHWTIAPQGVFRILHQLL